MTITASDLPTELLAVIVAYVGTNHRGRFYQDSVTAEDVDDFKRCSLVCLDWANWCRRCLFTDRPLIVKSLTELVALELYAVGGSKRLTPLHTLVGLITFDQNWTSGSWCHRAYHSSLLAKTSELVLRGPILAHGSRAAYRSPHWSLPRSMPRCYLPFERVALLGLHFPRLSDLGALTRHFASTPSVTFESVTWDNDDVSTWPRPLTRSSATGTWHRFAKKCTENVLPCLLALGPLTFAYMDGRDVAACVALLRAATGAEGKNPELGTVRCQSVSIERGCTLLYDDHSPGSCD